MWALLFNENVIVSTNPFLIFGKYSYLRPFLQKDAFIQILSWQRRKLNGWWWKLLGLSMLSSSLPTRIHLLPGLNHHPQEPVSTHQTVTAWLLSYLWLSILIDSSDQNVKTKKIRANSERKQEGRWRWVCIARRGSDCAVNGI